MPKIRYQTFNFRPATLERIDQAVEIIDEYRAQGFTLTLRQLYYQFVARALIPNTERSYKALGNTISDARLAGLIDWSSIEDRLRRTEIPARWDTPADILVSAASSWNVDHWVGQKSRPEVWIEKDALVGVIEGVCQEFDVPYLACRGYVSQSTQWRAGMRLRGYREHGQTPVVLHLGDHDPSGLDMTRDNDDRLDMFAQRGVLLRRLALNMDQVEEHGPPPNPAKVTDSRFDAYVDEHGYESWELDALEPQMISDLIRENLEGLIDRSIWDARVDEMENQRRRLRVISDRWEEVVDYLDDDQEDDEDQEE